MHKIVTAVAAVVAVAALIVAGLDAARAQPSQGETACQTANTEAAAQGVPMKSCKVASVHGVTVVLRQVGVDGTPWTVTVVRSGWRIVSVK
jgi:hypothetical protein